MGALARHIADLWRRVTHDQAPSEPADLYPERPMTSLFESLPADWKARLLSYRGPEDHGDADLTRSR